MASPSSKYIKLSLVILYKFGPGDITVVVHFNEINSVHLVCNIESELICRNALLKDNLSHCIH